MEKTNKQKNEKENTNMQTNKHVQSNKEQKNGRNL
jgi:hypothetical protein